MKFIVDRAKWFRGKGAKDSALLREDGARCCIGFVGQQCGVPDSLMLDRACIDGHSTTLEGFPEWMYKLVNSNVTRVERAYRVNDNPACGDEVRELELKTIFEANGDEIEFVG